MLCSYGIFLLVDTLYYSFPCVGFGRFVVAFVSILTTRLIPEEFLRTVLIENSGVDRNAKRQTGLAESHCSSELGAQSLAS